MIITCPQCNKIRNFRPSRIKELKSAYCKNCIKGHYFHSAEIRKKISIALKGKKAPNRSQFDRSKFKPNPGLFKIGHKAFNLKPEADKWKQKPWYRGLHKWVEYKLGKPRICQGCGTTESKIYEWANKDHSYKRNLEDWIRLCKKCHVILDLKIKEKRSFYGERTNFR